jgi:hypothetical protein
MARNYPTGSGVGAVPLRPSALGASSPGMERMAVRPCYSARPYRRRGDGISTIDIPPDP